MNYSADKESPLRKHAALRRARKLPMTHARNDLRQLAVGLLALDKRGFHTAVHQSAELIKRNNAPTILDALQHAKYLSSPVPMRMGLATMPILSRTRCPKCNQPMVLALQPGGKGP